MLGQMIPSQMKYTVEGSTPSYTDNVDQTIEQGTQVRLRIKGVRIEQADMFAIGSIREDYLGYYALPDAGLMKMLTVRQAIDAVRAG